MFWAIAFLYLLYVGIGLIWRPAVMSKGYESADVW